MSADESELREFYLAYIQLANAREFDRLDVFTHDPVGVNGQQVSRADITAEFRAYTEIIPDLHWEIQDLAIDGNLIAARLTDTGTPAKEWLGMAPTGAAVSFTECAFYRIRDGRIEASWYVMDTDGVRRQLTA
jgi:predicted ester cyclase